MTADTARVTAHLDAIEAAHAAATPGEWHVMRSADERRGYALALDRLVTDSAGCSIADAAAIVAAHNATPRLVAALTAVLDLHVPWYEIKGVRHEHTVTVGCGQYDGCDADGITTECAESDGDGHEVPACAECRWSDGEIDGNLLWPCPTVRAVAAALTPATEEQS